MEYSEKFKFQLPSRSNSDDMADINVISNNFRKIENEIFSKQEVENKIRESEEVLQKDIQQTQRAVESALDDTMELYGKTGELQEQVDERVKGRKGTNLFDKTAVTFGFYINPANGNLVENAKYCVTDFIPVKPNETYTVSIPYNSTFFTEDKKYLTGGTSSATFIVPENAYFYRCTVKNSNLDTFQMNKGDVLLPYDYYGARLTKDNFTSDLVYELKTEMDSLETEKDLNYFDNIIKHLTNPFIKTQIKLLGDSITAGQGGTGYSATGEPIPGTSWKANVLTATSWSNMLYHYIDDYYNKDVEVSALDEHIKYNSPSNNYFTFGTNQINIEGVSGYVNYYSYALHNGNVAIPNAVEFTFYGDHFSALYGTGKKCGVFEIYVDDEKVKEIDAYSNVDAARIKADVTGLTLGEHTVRVATTGRKNENASAYQFKIHGLVIPKTAIVKPWGVSGATSKYPIDVPSLYEEADDFVIMQFGTNDRHVFFTPDATYETLVNATNAIKTATGADVILMASCPASYRFEYGGDVVRHYHMWDVRNAIKKTAEHFRMPFIDNYDAFMKYAEEHSLEINEILFDGLHPNDLGYKVMFENIMRTLGLPIIPNYAENN